MLKIEKIGTCTLILGDCLDVMPALPRASVDLVLTDPPYGTTACSWDSIIPLDTMWDCLRSVMKPAASAVFTSAQPFTTKLISSNIDEFKYDWVWRKSKATGFLNSNRQPLRNKEDILVFCSGQTTYNPQYGRGASYTAKTGSKTENYGSFKSIEIKNDGRRCPLQVLDFAGATSTVHPTQKPLALMEYLIQTYSNAGESVLDFTMGSGTTLVACQRVDEATRQGDMFVPTVKPKPIENEDMFAGSAS